MSTPVKLRGHLTPLATTAFKHQFTEQAVCFGTNWLSSGPLCGFWSLKESLDNTASRLCPPTAFDTYPLCFRKNRRHAFVRAVARALLRIPIGTSMSGIELLGHYYEESFCMKKIRVAIAGVGNCASSLVQGLEYYKGRNDGASVSLAPGNL